MERAALSLAVSVVSPIFKMLGDKAAPYFGGDITEEELQHLQNIVLPKFRTVLRVAEAVPVDELKPWLRTLEAAAYEAEDVIDTYEYKRLEAEVSSLSDPLKKIKKKVKSFVSSFTLKTKLKNSMEKLLKSAVEADKLIFLYGAIGHTPLIQDIIEQQQQRRQQPQSVSSPSSPIFGRDEERESLINMLISTTNELSISEMSIPILSIYGIGGAGKTTLAQSVYNDSRVVEHFDRRMWVHVSPKFNAVKITTEIIESVTKCEFSKDIVNLDALQTKLKEILKSKKFLVVLDDVWCEDHVQWDQMLIPLNEVSDTKSRILVTNRTQEVALRLGIENVVPLKDLKVEDCMSIFKYYSLGDANKVFHDPQIAKIAEQIMMKLEKSPLSARIVGSLLRGKKNIADWKQIYNKGEMSKDTMATLYLSFENLEPHLQRCFAFCSLYPKGYKFYKREVDILVKYWIAHGFVEVSVDNSMTIEGKGMQYFNELLSHSFFQKETFFSSYYYAIHDLLHDLAEGVSKDHCFRIEDDTLRIPPTVMHLSISRKKDLSSNIKSEIFKMLNLRTFIIDKISEADFNSIFDVGSKIFDTFKKLRVLRLGDHEMSELHKSVGQLKHLRFFQVEVDRWPESPSRLYHLQFLGVRSQIPFIGRLTSLQNIKEYRVRRKTGHGVGQLKNLRELRGSLRICNLENVQNKAEASEASLNEKKLLEELSLEWSTYAAERDSRIDEEVIDGLEPSPNLNEVKISGYIGIGLPKWLLNDEGRVSNPQFSRLSKLSIVALPELKQVPSLPSTLKTIVIRRCWNLCEASSLPRDLRVVKVKECPKLMQLCPFPPNLEELEIEECPGVETLLWDVLLFESRDEQQQQQQEKQQLQLKTLSIKRCSVSGGTKRHLGSWNNKLLSSLSQLTLWDLPWLASLLLPDHNFTSLKSVRIARCENLREVSSLPVGLRVVKVTECTKLMQLCPFPPNLEELEIERCPGFETLLWDVLLFESRDEQQLQQQENDDRQLLQLKTLSIKRCSVSGGKKRHLGSWNKLFSSLSRLTLDNLPWLASLLLPGLTWLESVRIVDCENLELFGSSLASASSIKWLHVMGCPKLIVEGGERLLLLPSLTHLTIDDLSPLRRSPCINSLRSLTIENCREDIIAFTLEQEEELLPHLTSLTDLRIFDCPNLTSLPASLEKLSSLWLLSIRFCPKIDESLPNLPASLKKLYIEGCPKIESMPNLPASLKKLYIEGCPMIESLPNLPASLKELRIKGCPMIESLPNLPASVEKLYIKGCHPQLKESYGEGGPLHHKVRHIPSLLIL